VFFFFSLTLFNFVQNNLVDKRSFGDLEDDEDDIFGSKKVLFSFYDLYVCMYVGRLSV
jgi:hypothetical protein